jgi:hypothetical protein
MRLSNISLQSLIYHGECSFGRNPPYCNPLIYSLVGLKIRKRSISDSFENGQIQSAILLVF